MCTSKLLIILIGIILFIISSSKNIEKSDSIISIDVGGQIFKFHIKTLTKFPMLASMFNHQDQGMARGSPSKESCTICKSQVLLSRSYVVNLVNVGSSTQKSIKLHNFLMIMSESTLIFNLGLKIFKKK